MVHETAVENWNSGEVDYNGKRVLYKFRSGGREIRVCGYINTERSSENLVVFEPIEDENMDEVKGLVQEEVDKRAIKELSFPPQKSLEQKAEQAEAVPRRGGNLMGEFL